MRHIKPLYRTFTLHSIERIGSLLVFILFLSGCGNNAATEQAKDSDTTQVKSNAHAKEEFVGEYMIGDGVWIINPNNDTFEMRNAPGQDPYVLFLSGVESDTIQVYTTKDHAITLKMYPGHKHGMYFEDDEQWEVHWIKLHEETEEEESERLLRERAAEDEEAYKYLSTYDGTYTLFTESEGAEGKLELKYNNDRVFDFKLELKALDICQGSASGQVVMDRTQHGFFQTDGCMLHFNFMGNWGDSGMVVEIEQPEACSLMKGECIFTGKYTQGTPKP